MTFCPITFLKKGVLMSELLAELESYLGPHKPLQVDPDKSCLLKKASTYPSLEEIYQFLAKAVNYSIPLTTEEWNALVEQISYLRTFQKLEVLKMQNKTGLRQIKKCVVNRTLTTMDLVHRECKHAIKDRRYHLRWKKWMSMLCINESLCHPLNQKWLINDMQLDFRNDQVMTYNSHTTTPQQIIQSLGYHDTVTTLTKPSYNDIHESLPYTPLPYMLQKRQIKKIKSSLSFEPISSSLFGELQPEPIDIELKTEWTTEEDDYLLEIMESIYYTSQSHISKLKCWHLVAAIHNSHFDRPSDLMGSAKTYDEMQKRYTILSEQRPITNPLKYKDKIDKFFNAIQTHSNKKHKPIQPTKKQPHMADKLDLPTQTPQEVALLRTQEDPQVQNNQFYQYLNRPLTQQQQQTQKRQNTSNYTQPLQSRTAVEQWQSFLAQRQYLQSYSQPMNKDDEEEKKPKKKKKSTVTLKQQEQPAPQPAPMNSNLSAMNSMSNQMMNTPQMMNQYGYSNMANTNLQWMAHLQRQRYRQFNAPQARPSGLDIQHQAAIYSYQQRPQYYGQMGQYAQPPPPAQKPQKKRKKKKVDSDD